MTRSDHPKNKDKSSTSINLAPMKCMKLGSNDREARTTQKYQNSQRYNYLRKCSKKFRIHQSHSLK